MALSGCHAVVKYIVVFVNFIFWLTGLAVLSLSIWMLVDSSFYLSVIQHTGHYHVGLGLLLAAGALMFLVGFLGCCGAFRESFCMLVTFFLFLLIILVAEVASAAWAYTNKDELLDILRNNVKYSVQEEYSIVPFRTVTIDEIQKTFHCCGADGPKDWEDSKYNRVEKSDFLNVATSALSTGYRVPLSCCRTEGPTCQAAQSNFIIDYVGSVIYNEGCTHKLIEILKEYMNVVVGVGFAIIIMEILGLICSLILCCAIRNTDRYKA